MGNIPIYGYALRESYTGSVDALLPLMQQRNRRQLRNAEDAYDFAEIHAKLAEKTSRDFVEQQAAALGVTFAALEALSPVALTYGGDTVLAYPEFNGSAQVTGMAHRCTDGTKKALKGSHRGIYIPKTFLNFDGPIYCCEGPSDTAALLTMGLAAVGRPSAFGGIQHLTTLFGKLPVDRKVVILGENDRKDDGRWPGREAAVKLASMIEEVLERSIDVALPPEGFKDVRDWLLKHNDTEGGK